MKADQDTINRVVSIYNMLMDAHKRAPVEAYVRKQLEQEERVELLAGNPRWVTALHFFGGIDDMQVDFVINPALPAVFQQPLQAKKELFEKQIQEMTSRL